MENKSRCYGAPELSEFSSSRKKFFPHDIYFITSFVSLNLLHPFQPSPQPPFLWQPPVWPSLFMSFQIPYRSWIGPGISDNKESACNVGDLGLIPGSGRYPGEGTGNPLQYSCLGNLMDREAWQGCKESDTTERSSLVLYKMHVKTIQTQSRYIKKI